MMINYRLKTVQQEQANLLNELSAAETWAKDEKRELWLEEQIAWDIKDMGQDLLHLWDWIVELDLRHNHFACVVADYDWEGQQKIIEELLTNYIQSVDAYLRIRKSPLPPFGKLIFTHNFRVGYDIISLLNFIALRRRRYDF